MIQKVIIINAYEYIELSETAKERVKQWYLNDCFRSEQLSNDYIESYTKYFFPNSKLMVQWSLSSCQGDGVNLYGELFLSDVVDYIRNWNEQDHSDQYAYDPSETFTEKELKRIEWYVKHPYNVASELLYNQRHCYSLALSIEFADAMISDLENNNVRDIKKSLIERFEDEVKKIVTSLCWEMEHYGYEYLYEVEDEEIIDMCISNDWLFDEYGKLV